MVKRRSVYLTRVGLWNAEVRQGAAEVRNAFYSERERVALRLSEKIVPYGFVRLHAQNAQKCLMIL